MISCFLQGIFFFSKAVFEKVGGFLNFKSLYAFDFLLRAARIEEPYLVRSKLIACRPTFLDRRLGTTASIEEERSQIISSHLLELLAASPANSNCDVFRSHPCMFAGINWSLALADAVDGWVEMRQAIKDERDVERSTVAASLKGKHFNLMTHELSLSGAPVIVLEMACLLIAQGAKVTVISPTDGPLRTSFEQRGVSIVTLPRTNSKLSALKTKLAKYKTQNRLKWVFRQAVYNVRRRIDRARQYRARMLIKKARGLTLINSVAAWEWVYRYLTDGKGGIVWFIHETFDPKWIAVAAADKLFRKSIAEGSLTMLFGSEATARTWALEGYPGHVRYWSGISANRYPGNQLTAVAPTKGKRVLLNVGSAGTRKGTRNLLEAFAYGKKNGIIPDDVELRILGLQKPSSKQETRDIVFRAYQADLRDYVRLIGILKPEAIESYYDEADIYVHSSYFDCMPIAILTAMARGLPIVATDVDGCGEAIIDGETGILAPPRSPRQLAIAIGKLLHDDVLREKVAHGAREIFVRKFSVEATFDPVRQVIDPETHALVTGRATEADTD